MPARWRQRCHSQIPSESVTAWNLSALALHARLSARNKSTWQRICKVDNWFEHRVAKHLSRWIRQSRTKPVVFSYSYAARAIFEVAKRHGCPTILGQIDPGPVEMQLVQELEHKYGFTDSEWPPQQYWDDWKQECELADAIVVNSEWSQKALLQENIAANRIHVIPLAYEQPKPYSGTQTEVPAQFTAQRPLRVLFLGQVNLRKGVRELIDAIKDRQGSHLHWTIVGGGHPALLAELQQLPQTTVTGPVSRSAAAEYYAHADVFVLPTHSDGFALTQLEAATYGLPIIASKHCGDVVVDQKNGIRLNEVTATEIAAAIQTCLAEPAMLQRFRDTQNHRFSLSIQGLGQQLQQLAANMEKRKA